MLDTYDVAVEGGQVKRVKAESAKAAILSCVADSRYTIFDHSFYNSSSLAVLTITRPLATARLVKRAVPKSMYRSSKTKSKTKAPKSKSKSKSKRK